MRVTIGQFEPKADSRANLARITEMAGSAAHAGSELLILPEESMLAADALTDQPLHEVVGEAWPRFVKSICALSTQLGVAIIAGAYEPSDTLLPFNSILVVEAGEVLGIYRKMHLYDAFSYQESHKIMRGEGGPLVVSIGGFNIGIINCYDLRFPEFSRSLVEMGADVLSVSAAWASGPVKEYHWQTLLCARAIENTCWVAAAAVASPDCIGHSMLVDPLGIVRAALGEERSGLLTADVDKERLDEVRSTVPVLRNRRIIIGDR